MTDPCTRVFRELYLPDRPFRNRHFDRFTDCVPGDFTDDIFYRSFFPSLDRHEQLKNVGTLAMPDLCCVCMKPATVLLPMRELSIYGRLRQFFGKNHPQTIPHCWTHGSQKFAYFSLYTFCTHGSAPKVTCYGANLDFLGLFVAENTRGEVPPPWVTFPDVHVHGFWYKHFATEDWWDFSWVPFWNRLSHTARLEYLDRWPPPEGRRDEYLYPNLVAIGQGITFESDLTEKD